MEVVKMACMWFYHLGIKMIYGSWYSDPTVDQPLKGKKNAKKGVPLMSHQNFKIQGLWGGEFLGRIGNVTGFPLATPVGSMGPTDGVRFDGTG